MRLIDADRAIEIVRNECSYCHAEENLTLYDENYCPNCGAKMDEEVSK